jgi:hypothetical protein
MRAKGTYEAAAALKIIRTGADLNNLNGSWGDGIIWFMMPR